jgi:hypothetical protein
MGLLKAPARHDLETMHTPRSLREFAERCRRLARMSSDDEVSARLEQLALEYDARAETAVATPDGTEPAQ